MKIETNDWVSVRQFADNFGVSVQRVFHYIKMDRIKNIRLDNYFFIHKSEIAKWPPKLLKIGRPKNENR